MNSTLIHGTDNQVFRVEPRINSPKVLNVTQEYPNGELLGLATWVEGLELYLIFQVGVVALPHPIACSKREKLPELLQALLKITPQPTCGVCSHFDAARNCCRKRRDQFVSWTACLLPTTAEETACSLFTDK
ncbi:MAG: hypothetical protein ACRC62_20405 [Microcoleus sp.]